MAKKILPRDIAECMNKIQGYCDHNFCKTCPLYLDDGKCTFRYPPLNWYLVKEEVVTIEVETDEEQLEF